MRIATVNASLSTYSSKEITKVIILNNYFTKVYSTHDMVLKHQQKIISAVKLITDFTKLKF